MLCKETLGSNTGVGVEMFLLVVREGRRERELSSTPSYLSCVLLCVPLQTVMEFRHPDGHLVAVVLPARSLLVMKGESRYLWTHGWAHGRVASIARESLYLDMSLGSIHSLFKVTAFPSSVLLQGRKGIMNDLMFVSELNTMFSRLNFSPTHLYASHT